VQPSGDAQVDFGEALVAIGGEEQKPLTMERIESATPSVGRDHRHR
jgi:hypothetical protein